MTTMRSKTEGKQKSPPAATTQAATRERFAECVAAAGGSRAAAELLACSRSYVDMIIGGQRTPGLRMAYAVERVFRIRMKAWLVLESAAAHAA